MEEATGTAQHRHHVNVLLPLEISGARGEEQLEPGEEKPGARGEEQVEPGTRSRLSPRRGAWSPGRRAAGTRIEEPIERGGIYLAWWQAAVQVSLLRVNGWDLDQTN